MKLLLSVLLLPALMTGCMHLPAEVAAELSAPDGHRPNNYAGPGGTAAATAEPEAESP